VASKSQSQRIESRDSNLRVKIAYSKKYKVTSIKRFIIPPPVGKGAVSVAVVHPPVRLSMRSSVAYIANNSRTQRPIECPNMEGRLST